MDQFTVPQFIEREAKILGPITVRQFIICLIAVGFMALAYKLSDFSLFIVEAIFIAIFFAVFAFIKINGRPFHYFLLALIGVAKRPSVRVWKKDYKRDELRTKTAAEPTSEQKKQAAILAQKEQIQSSLAQKKLAHSRLSKLSLTVDTGGKFREEKNNHLK